MSLVERQSPEQIESRGRRNFRRAAIGVAACIGGLLGISTVAAAVVAHKVEQAQEALENDLMPGGASRPAVYHHVSKQQPIAEQWPPVSLHIDGEEPKPRDTSIEWAVPLGAIGSTAVVSMGALMTLGAAKRRHEAPDAPEEVDYETTDEYAFYDFELHQIRGEQRMRDGMDQLESGLQDHEPRLYATMIRERMSRPETIGHMRTLSGMRRNPLEALNYTDGGEFHTRLQQGESVAAACDPLWTGLQHA